MEDEQVKHFINADLANLSYEEFSEKFNVSVPQTNDFIENLEWALLFLDSHQKCSPWGYSELKEDCFNLNTFDGAWLFAVDRLGGMGDDLKFLAPKTTCQATINMFKTFNVKVFDFGARKVENEKDRMLYMQKFRVMDPKEVRHLRQYAPYIVEDRLAFMDAACKWYTKGQYRAALPTKVDVDGNPITITCPIPVTLNPNYYITQKAVRDFIRSEDFQKESDRLNMMINVRLTAYYEWFVYIRENEKSIGVKLPVAPENAKEIFALRDIPEGQKRKKAICHFVKEHYRNVRTRPEYDEEKRQALVKQHLRGETKFNWRGLQVNIIPAEYDLNRIKTRKKFLTI